MKRSEINVIILEALALCESRGLFLPPFARWTPADWADRGPEYDEIEDNMLGWDITDFGSGDFAGTGLLMFTLRNGHPRNPAYQKPYAEKILISRENQRTPTHFHTHKMEDIINRSGGNLIVRLYNSAPDGSPAPGDVPVTADGRKFTVKAGEPVRIGRGESITLARRQYHEFWGEEGHGAVILGEVSTTNDDNTDNTYAEKVGRFPAVEEDEPALYPLCNEYAKWRGR